MARLTSVYRTEDMDPMIINRRQLPVLASDNLMMMMDMNSKGLCIDSPQIRGKELEEFTRKFNLLSDEELRNSLEINNYMFTSVLNQSVQCVGCRRHVEKLLDRLAEYSYPTLYPLVIKKGGVITVNEDKLRTPQQLGTLLYRHHDVLNNLLESKLRNKTRCLLHSLDTFRSKPFSETWRDIWSSMKHSCRDELAVIDTKELHDVLENYLKKHKFCQGCRTKIEKAYKMLVGETTSKEKGFVAALYSNIKKCTPDKHVHVFTNKIDFLDGLIKRAEPEVNGSYSKARERHAKTLEVAQEEVLTCVGMILYERLRRIYISLREEERACQVLAAVGVHSICRSFDTFVEQKQGVSNLELLYQEISRAERAKEIKRELKKLKKKRKKNEKKNLLHACERSIDVCSDMAEADEAEPDETSELCDESELEENSSKEEFEEYFEKLKRPTPDSNVEVDTNSSTKQLNEDKLLSTEKEDIEIIPEIKSETSTQESHVTVQEQQKAQQSQQQHQKKKKPQKKKQKQQTQQIEKKNKKLSTVNTSNKYSANSIENMVPNNATPSIAIEPALPSKCCNECMAPTPHDCPCENDIKDSGYGSEPTSHDTSPMSSAATSPEGSEVSCSDGFCNHENSIGNDLDEEHISCQSCESYDPFLYENDYAPSLQQMLENIDEFEDGENYYIPDEVLLKYQCQSEKVQQMRLQLRKTLQENFARLCMQGDLSRDT